MNYVDSTLFLFGVLRHPGSLTTLQQGSVLANNFWQTIFKRNTGKTRLLSCVFFFFYISKQKEKLMNHSVKSPDGRL